MGKTAPTTQPQWGGLSVPPGVGRRPKPGADLHAFEINCCILSARYRKSFSSINTFTYQYTKQINDMSHHQINQLIHLMWSTINLQPHFFLPLKNELYAYMTTLVKKKNGNVITIGGPSDHIHLLTTLPPDIFSQTLYDILNLVLLNG